MNDKELQTAVNYYLGTLLWSETLAACDEEGVPGVLSYRGTQYRAGCPLQDIIDVSDVDRINPDITKEVEADLNDFVVYCMREIGIDPFRFFDPKEVAHNFCLSRNGHGAGFFDGSWVVETKRDGLMFDKRDLAKDLQSCAEAQGTHGLTVWVAVDAEGNESLKMRSHS